MSLIMSHDVCGHEHGSKLEHLSFSRVVTFFGHDAINEESYTASKMILEARDLRAKYQQHLSTNASEVKAHEDSSGRFAKRHKTGNPEVSWKGGVVAVEGVPPAISLQNFVADHKRLCGIVTSGEVRTYSYSRLKFLQSNFELHCNLNGRCEDTRQGHTSKCSPHDFYSVTKVDNHIHLAAAAPAFVFANFVKKKLQQEPDTVVTNDNKTLREVFVDAGIDHSCISIDAFNVLADHSTYQRFDKFNSKYSPFKLAKMRLIFLKSAGNPLKGRFFAELTQEVLKHYQSTTGTTNQCAELRVSIYGNPQLQYVEWQSLAEWVLTDWGGEGNLLSPCNRWVVQIPRLYRVFRGKGLVSDFACMMRAVFEPLIQATLHPDQHPRIAELLLHVVALDSVDDESNPEEPLVDLPADQWTEDGQPHYAYQLYHLYANLQVLNTLRSRQGLNTVALRPHAGESGDCMHMASAYLLAQSVNHGIQLDKQVSLQYLFMLDQVGCSVSPMSNKFLFAKLQRNPFYELFQRGLNVTLSTDDPMLFHLSRDALLEEYSVARVVWGLSMTDMCEIARRSVLQSGFSEVNKKQWLGEDLWSKSNVPTVRRKFRQETLAREHTLLRKLAELKGDLILKAAAAEYRHLRELSKELVGAGTLTSGTHSESCPKKWSLEKQSTPSRSAPNNT